MAKQIAVIGLGKFGTNLCLELAKHGAEVLAVDIEEKPVLALSDVVSQAIIADTTDETVLSELNLSNFDYVVVSIGSEMRSSILVTLILKETGVRNLWVKAKDKLHVKALKKIGADHIINPERDMAMRISEQLVTDGLVDYLYLPDNLAIYEFMVPSCYINSPISALNLSNEVQLLALKRGTQLIKIPVPEDIILEGDIYIIGGNKQNLQAYLSRL